MELSQKTRGDPRSCDSTLARLILILALLLPVYFAGAALGARFGVFDWRFGLGTLIVEWGPRLIIGVLVLAVVILIATLVKAPRAGLAVGADCAS